VTCREDVDVEGLIQEFGLAPTQVYHYALNGFAAPMGAATLQQLRQDRRILFVEADGPVSLCDQTNSTGLLRLGLDHFPLAHINGTNEPLNVDVAVLDSGIDPHPDLSIYQTYYAFSSDGSDSIGHGTAVAGVLAAMDNGYGVVGVAPGVRLWNIKCVGPPPYNAWSFAIAGMNYVTAHSNEISVANMSFGNSSTSAPISSIRSAVRHQRAYKLNSLGRSTDGPSRRRRRRCSRK
jgi:hypothetical protein